MGRPTNESKEIAALVEQGMTQEEAEKLTPEERATLLEKPVERTVEQADQDLNSANAELEEMRAKLAAVTAAHEQELAAAKAEATNAKAESEELRQTLATMPTFTGEERGERGYSGKLRIKTPMLINPVLPADYHPETHGPVPAAYPLQKGLNVDVPEWVARTPIVQANLEDDGEE